MAADRVMNTNVKSSTRVAVLGGSWSSNVGNAFYNLGATWLMEQLCTDVWFVPESPRWKEPTRDDFDLVGHLDCDLVLMIGPCLNLKLADVYSESFQRIYDRGAKVGYLSVGMSLYDQGEAGEVKKFFDKFPPAFISTRDDMTHQFIEPLVSCPTYSGLCTSLYLNDAYSPPPITKSPYVVLNFDSHEPALSFDDQGIAKVQETPRGLFGKKAVSLPDKIQGLDVVRTCNLSIDDGYGAIYGRPMAYHSDLPGGYCSILKHAQCVYSERVHTCAATLIYGSKAQFIAQSDRSFEKRSLLFKQIGLEDIFKRPVQIDFDKLNPLKERQTEFLRGALT